MNLYLCGQSALDVTRYLRATDDGAIDGRRSRPAQLSGAVHTNKQLLELDETAQHWLSHTQGRVHAFVPERSMLTQTKRLVTHLWTDAVLSGMFINLGHGVYLSSPGFIFLQLARKLDRVGLIKLGLELCGTYSCWKLPLPSLKQHEAQDEFYGATYDLPSATTPKLLKQFIHRMAGQRGAVGARAALPYVLANSASPMESAVYLLLCLPRHMGGFGLPKPVFNPKVYVSSESGRVERFPDLFWRARGIDVEYNSDEKHSGEWARYADSKREVELTVEEYSVLPLTRAQLRDAQEFELFANGLRRLLGIRGRKVEGWGAKYRELRTLVM